MKSRGSAQRWEVICEQTPNQLGANQGYYRNLDSLKLLAAMLLMNVSLVNTIGKVHWTRYHLQRITYSVKAMDERKHFGLQRVCRTFPMVVGKQFSL